MVLTHGATIPDRDFVLRYRPQVESIEPTVLAARAGNEGFFTLALHANTQVTEGDLTPRELVFVMDTFCDGLVAKPKADGPADSIEKGGVTFSFDGDPKKAKQTEAEYAKAFSDADAAYSQILQVLITKLKSGT